MPNIADIFNEELNIKYLCIRNASGAKQSKSFVCKKGMRPYSRFFYIKSGELSFYTPSGQEHLLTAGKGDIVYLPGDIEYRSVWKDENDIDFVSILAELTDSSGNPFTLYNKICIMVKDTHNVYLRNFESIYEIYNGGQLGYKFICRSEFWKILYDILSDWTTSRLERRDSVYRGIFYIENNYQHEIDIASLASSCGLCQSAFRKKFRKITGMSPIEYKNFLKTKKAIELMSFGEFNVTEVSDIVGFSDVFYFCKQFKRFWGTTPKQYILNHKQ